MLEEEPEKINDDIDKHLLKMDIDEKDKILEWCIKNRNLKITFNEEFGLKYWGFSWDYGFNGFLFLGKKEEEDKAREATAIFIYLWVRKVCCQFADEIAEKMISE